MKNYRFLTTETNLKALYIFRCLFTTSSVKLFIVNVQIFVYNRVFRKRKNNSPKTFQLLKMKAHFEKEPHFENESLFWNPVLKWKHVNPFSKKLQLAKSIKNIMYNIHPCQPYLYLNSWNFYFISNCRNNNNILDVDAQV